MPLALAWLVTLALVSVAITNTGPALRISREGRIRFDFRSRP